MIFFFFFIFQSASIIFRRGPRKIKNSKYYQVLGVSKSSNEDKIKQTYRRATKKKKGHNPFDIFESVSNSPTNVNTCIHYETNFTSCCGNGNNISLGQVAIFLKLAHHQGSYQN
ncbi:hypothetical protein TanjilG_06137 [Lupinus angustifolius]|uniref:J domain-containing protein n=1 Tax=Lupinus angustifolius TaxID=3871 RepID=A0A394DF62_LUPAN|nr:hypothetical protein TanjilG_06137 [Lupinus angustifolius]